MKEIEILIVEDNPQDLELATRALKKHKIANSILALTDGAEALDFLFARGAHADREGALPPSVVFLDLKLPKVDGIEVLRQLKADPRTRAIPVVILTSSAQERDRWASYDVGANSFVVKPIDFENFSKTIGELGFYWLAVNRPPR